MRSLSVMAGAMLDEGFMAEARAKAVQQERGIVRSLTVCGQFSLSGRELERLGRVEAEAKRKIDLRGEQR